MKVVVSSILCALFVTAIACSDANAGCGLLFHKQSQVSSCSGVSQRTTILRKAPLRTFLHNHHKRAVERRARWFGIRSCSG